MYQPQVDQAYHLSITQIHWVNNRVSIQQQHLFICTLSNKIKIYSFFFIIIVEYWLPEITIGARRARQPVIY